MKTPACSFDRPLIRRTLLQAAVAACLVPTWHTAHAQPLALSTAINRTARFRALSQRIAKAYCQIHLNVLPEQSRAVLASARKLVHSGFADLAQTQWSPELSAQLLQVQALAQGLEALLVLPPSKESVAAVALQADKMLLSADVATQSLEKLSNDEVRVRAIHGGVGAINESDVMLANASNAIIVGFNVRPDAGALASAEQNEVDIRLYRVIYQAIEEIEAAMKGMLDPEFKEVVIGYAEVRQTFKVSNVGTIAGCYVTQGKIQRNAEIRIVRNGIIVHEGTINSLKRFKDDAKEVAENFECGIGVENFNDIKEGDTIECFVMEEIER